MECYTQSQTSSHAHDAATYNFNGPTIRYKINRSGRSLMTKLEVTGNAATSHHRSSFNGEEQLCLDEICGSLTNYLKNSELWDDLQQE